MKHPLFVPCRAVADWRWRVRLSVALFARSARCRLAGALVTASAAVLRLSKHVATPPPADFGPPDLSKNFTTFSAETLLPSSLAIPSELNHSTLFPQSPNSSHVTGHTSQPLTVAELLENADRWNRPVFALRVPGFLIQISKLNDLLEKATSRAGDEGDPQQRRLQPFFARNHRPTHDTMHL